MYQFLSEIELNDASSKIYRRPTIYVLAFSIGHRVEISVILLQIWILAIFSVSNYGEERIG